MAKLVKVNVYVDSVTKQTYCPNHEQNLVCEENNQFASFTTIFKYKLVLGFDTFEGCNIDGKTKRVTLSQKASSRAEVCKHIDALLSNKWITAAGREYLYSLVSAAESHLVVGNRPGVRNVIEFRDIT